MQLAIEPLTRDAFAPFGDVIEAAADHLSFPINAGTSQRFHDLARLDPGEGGRLIVSIFRAQPRRLPLAITMLERHPKASQAFMPLAGRPFLVVVAPKGEQIDPAQIRAFLAQGKQGINFAAGVVTGIVQEFQFGMNWSEYSRYVGDIFGAPLAFASMIHGGACGG